jgi:hypothetical protein
MKIQALGIPWYRREDYARILAVMTDANLLPRTHEQWLRKAEDVERRCKGQGMTVVRAVIDPDTFPDWCRTRGLNVDAKARTEFANEHAYLTVKNAD